MARINVKTRVPGPVTNEGAPASRIGPEMQLRRSVMACMLWENNFYESGVSIAQRLIDLVGKVGIDKVSRIAIEARSQMNLRHAPLLLANAMVKNFNKSNTNGNIGLIATTIANVIQRPDELGEFLAMYNPDGKQKLTNQIKKGLAMAFQRFDEYQLAKYNRDGKYKLKDVLFLCHAKPESNAEGKLVEIKDKTKGGTKKVVRHKSGQGEMWARLINDQLKTPDTWEVAISAAKGNKDKSSKEWKRLLSEKKLGGLALLRNLRNMQEAGIDTAEIGKAIREMNTSRILPFRFIAAAGYGPKLEPDLEVAMFKCTAELPKIKGKTVIVVDVSGSMDTSLSSKSDMKRFDAACGMAMILREVCDEVAVYAFSDSCKLIPSRRGFALRDAIVNSMYHSSTYLGKALDYVNKSEKSYDRIVVITDEQSHDEVRYPNGASKGYMINVGTDKNGVGYGKWVHIDGFSESIIKYMVELESSGIDTGK